MAGGLHLVPLATGGCMGVGGVVEWSYALDAALTTAAWHSDSSGTDGLWV